MLRSFTFFFLKFVGKPKKFSSYLWFITSKIINGYYYAQTLPVNFPVAFPVSLRLRRAFFSVFPSRMRRKALFYLCFSFCATHRSSLHFFSPRVSLLDHRSAGHVWLRSMDSNAEELILISRRKWADGCEHFLKSSCTGKSILKFYSFLFLKLKDIIKLSSFE